MSAVRVLCPWLVEFIMKDAYSSTSDPTAAKVSQQNMAAGVSPYL
jgi:hypothetical protein